MVMEQLRELPITPEACDMALPTACDEDYFHFPQLWKQPMHC